MNPINQAVSIEANDSLSPIRDYLKARLFKLWNNPVTSLRLAGILLLIVSMAGYLLQGFHGPWTTIYRWAIFGFVMILFGSGLLSAYLLKEKTGARIFFALAAGLTPVQVAQSSAWLLDWLAPNLPGLLFASPQWWQAPSAAGWQVLVVAFLSLLMSAMVGYFAFAILARRHTLPFVRLFLITNLLLLLPWRTGLLAGLTVLSAVSVMVWHEIYGWKDEPLLRTLEGLSARLLVAVPGMILVARVLVYGQNDLFYAFVLGLVAFPFIWLARILDHGWPQLAAELAGLILICLALAIVGLEIYQWVGESWPFIWLTGIGIFFYPWMIDATDHRESYLVLGIVVVLVNLMSAAVFLSSVSLSIFTCVIAAFLSLVARASGHRRPAFLAMVGVLLGAIWSCKLMLANFHIAAWINAGILGTGILLAGSVWEKKRLGSQPFSPEG